MPRTFVVNASPLIFLTRVGRLDLLSSLADPVLAPAAVLQELAAGHQKSRHLCPIRVPNSELLVAYGRKMVCGVRLQMRGGEQSVAVAVRDEIADSVSIVRFDLTIPGP